MIMIGPDPVGVTAEEQHLSLPLVALLDDSGGGELVAVVVVHVAVVAAGERHLRAIAVLIVLEARGCAVFADGVGTIK